MNRPDPALTAAVGGALLDFEQAPGRYAVAAREPRLLFDHLLLVLGLAAGRGAGDDASPPAWGEAARFFVRTVLLHPDAPPHTLLGVTPDAMEPQRLREHYRLLMRMTHPDAVAQGHAWPADAAARINEAYRLLGDEDSRLAYAAAHRASHGARPPPPRRPGARSALPGRHRPEPDRPRRAGVLAWTAVAAIGALTAVWLWPLQPDPPLLVVAQRPPAALPLEANAQPQAMPGDATPGGASDAAPGDDAGVQTLAAAQAVPVPAAVAPQPPAQAVPAGPARVSAPVTTPVTTPATTPVMAPATVPVTARASAPPVVVPTAAATAAATAGAPAAAGTGLPALRLSMALTPQTAPAQAAAPARVPPAAAAAPAPPAPAVAPAPSGGAAPALAAPAAVPVPAPTPAILSALPSAREAAAPSTAPQAPAAAAAVAAAAADLRLVQPLLAEMLLALQSGQREQVRRFALAHTRQPGAAAQFADSYARVLGAAPVEAIDQARFSARTVADVQIVEGFVRLRVSEPGVAPAWRDLRVKAHFILREGGPELSQLDALPP